MELYQYRRLEKQINADLRAVFEKHGLKLGHVKATVYDTGVIKYRLEVADTNLKDHNGDQITPEALRWNMNAVLYNLPLDALNKSVRIGSKIYRIMGLAEGRSEKRVVLSHGDKTYRGTPQQVLTALRAPPAWVGQSDEA
jgi:hypothetical protein